MNEQLIVTMKERDFLLRENAALQAKIDSLMLEFCPEEMTKEQLDNWERHQRISEVKL